jgi:hypothetical protein
MYAVYRVLMTDRIPWCSTTPSSVSVQLSRLTEHRWRNMLPSSILYPRPGRTLPKNSTRTTETASYLNEWHH